MAVAGGGAGIGVYYGINSGGSGQSQTQVHETGDNRERDRTGESAEGVVAGVGGVGGK